MSEPEGFVLSRDDTPICWQADILWPVLAHHGTTSGRFSLMEELCPKGSGPPPPSHVQDEMFHLIDGAITFRMGQEITTAGAGAFTPRGTAQGFRVDNETARVLDMNEPAGFEPVPMGTAPPSRSGSTGPISALPRPRPRSRRRPARRPWRAAAPAREPRLRSMPATR